MKLSVLRLKKHEDRRIREGHLWVYSNEVDVAKTPLSHFAAGQLVTIEAADGKPLGVGYVNAQSLICGRILCRDATVEIDKSFFSQRITQALALRDRLFAKPYYRLVFSDGDFLPGLIVDRYGEALVVQIMTAGMENLTDEIVSALQDVLQPSSILLRNDSSIRQLEGLPLIVEPIFGVPPTEVLLEENGVSFQVAIATGQKTGWFYDHRLNRNRLRQYVSEKRVLDMFSYVGGWGVQAAAFGASQVLCVDSSEQALMQAKQNAVLNHVESSVATHCEDGFDALKALGSAGERFDVIILDPPAFIKKRKDIKEGVNAYRRINELALRLLPPGGILVSASCSLHLQREVLVDVLAKASSRMGSSLQILEQGHQGPDHPIHPAIPETDYLKAFFCRIS